MNSQVYTEVILPQLLQELQDQGLTLCQDADSVHKSQVTTAWAKKHGLSLLTLPGFPPDFSILELLTYPLKKAFHAERCTTEKASLTRFTRIHNSELDQKMV